MGPHYNICENKCSQQYDLSMVYQSFEWGGKERKKEEAFAPQTFHHSKESLGI